MKIIQVAGYSNSGKTTFIQQLVKRLSAENLDIAVIKHHGHGDRLIEQDTGKDSWKFRQSGAVASTVIAANTIQMQFSKKQEWTVQDAIVFNEFLETDLVIIEGFKRESFPKVVIIRDEKGLELLNELENIKAILCWESFQAIPNIDVPIFKLEDHVEFFEWFLKNVMEDCE